MPIQNENACVPARALLSRHWFVAAHGLVRKTRQRFAAGVAGALMLLAPAWAVGAPSLNVVVSFSILEDLARQVGGGRIRMTTLVGRDGDAHVYEPRPADAAAIAAADVVLVNGLNFEGFLPRLLAATQTRAPIVELASGVSPLLSPDTHHARNPHDAGHSHSHATDGHHHGPHDPHAWQSLRNAQTYVTNIATAFCDADARGCETYQANARAYHQQLAVLDGEIRAAMAAIPADRRVVITSHDAFQYFGRDYGIRFIGVEGLSTDAEASAADVAALIRQIREGGASAVFVENIANPRLLAQIAREANVAMGGVLYSDALSKEDGPAASYIDMMRTNAATLERAITRH